MPVSPEKLLAENAAYRLTTHRLVQGETEVCATAQGLVYSEGGRETRRVELPPPPAGCAGYRGSIPALTAAYALALKELFENESEAGLLAGANWSTVWTRDIAYAAALGGALAAPEAVRRSLESRVRDGVILQDTGTGGGWPVSTDRVSWALGAWAYIKLTGDEAWSKWATDVILATLEEDARVLPPVETSPLRSGETSFLDWRLQSYPDGTSIADIGSSYAFGTNVLHAIARHIASLLLKQQGRKVEAEKLHAESAAITAAIQKNFYRAGTGQYGMTLTADGHLDERTDSLATALAVLCGVAGDHGARALHALPRSPWGTPVFAPYKASVKDAYHNRAVWPFVEAFVMLAHAELQDTAGASFSLSSLLRAALAFGTHKENFNAESGRAEETLLNSDRQLWSDCGMLGAVYHGLFGLQFQQKNLFISPCVPKEYGGSHWLTGLRVRGMVLDIHLHGYGTEIAAVTVNGKPGSSLIPLETEGHLYIEIELMPIDEEETALSFTPAAEDLPTPCWDAPTRERLSWHPVEGAASYCIYRDGRAFATTFDCYRNLDAADTRYHSYAVQAVGQNKASSLSTPFECAPEGSEYTLTPARIGAAAEYTVEHGQAWLDTQPHTARLDYEEVTLPAGTYRLRVHYTNATASERDGDTCALRELFLDGASAALLVLPHNTEAGQWDNDALTAALTLDIPEGAHTFSLRYTDRCVNANRELNQCMVRALQLTRISSSSLP